MKANNKAKASRSISVVLATYTGEEHVEACLNSVLAQKNGDYSYEVVVIIDGPNVALRGKIDEMKEKFNSEGTQFTVHQFKKNKGRYIARLTGAEMAQYSQLLFVDDRTTLDSNFIVNTLQSNSKVAIANAIELESPTMISRTMFLLRKRLYSSGFGDNFTSFYVDKSNFEKTAKGTAGFWVGREMFINACEEIHSSDDAKNVNEDTKLFKAIINSGQKILKSSESKLYYRPRTGLRNELSHLYHRGPRFLDYYFKKGTRYFPHIVLFILCFPALIVLGFVYSEILVFFLLSVLAIILIGALVIAELSRDVFRVVLSVPLIITAFSAGIIKGLAGKAMSQKQGS